MDDSRLNLICWLRNGVYIEAFGERGYFHASRAIHYVAWLVGNPEVPRSAADLLHEGKTCHRDFKDGDPTDQPANDHSETFQPGIDARAFREIRDALRVLKELTIPSIQTRLSKAVANGETAVAEELQQDRAEAEQERNSLEQFLRDNTVPSGRAKNINGYGKRVSARTTTRGNLFRFFAELDVAGMSKTLKHFQQGIRYIEGCWIYYPAGCAWVVEWDR